MRVKLCSRYPYTPRDLPGHYDPEDTLHACANCDGEQGECANYYPRNGRNHLCALPPDGPHSSDTMSCLTLGGAT